MPYVRRKKAGSRVKRRVGVRKTGARRGRTNRSKVYNKGKATKAIIRQPSGVPDRLFVKLRYAEKLSFTQAAGALALNVYRGNSVFDPNLTGVGGQPYYHDQWSGFYSNYRVNGCAINVMMMANGSTMPNLMFGIVPTAFSSGITTADIDLIQELPRSKRAIMKMGAAGIGQGIVKGYCSTSQGLNISRIQTMADPNLFALTSANPATSWFWQAWCYCPGGDNVSAIMEVKLTYYVEYFHRKLVASS